MKINYKMLSGILAVVLIYDAKVAFNNRKKFVLMKKHIEQLSALSAFYAAKLDEANVEVTEFDKIAVDSIFD